MDVITQVHATGSTDDVGPPADRETIRFVRADDHVVVLGGLRMLRDNDHQAGRSGPTAHAFATFAA
jgi:hypothetical protein